MRCWAGAASITCQELQPVIDAGAEEVNNLWAASEPEPGGDQERGAGGRLSRVRGVWNTRAHQTPALDPAAPDVIADWALTRSKELEKQH